MKKNNGERKTKSPEGSSERKRRHGLANLALFMIHHAEVDEKPGCMELPKRPKPKYVKSSIWASSRLRGEKSALGQSAIGPFAFHTWPKARDFSKKNSLRRPDSCSPGNNL